MVVRMTRRGVRVMVVEDDRGDAETMADDR